MSNEAKENKQSSTSWKTFLESTPPSDKAHWLSDVFNPVKKPKVRTGPNVYDLPKGYLRSLNLPSLELFCLSDTCVGYRKFSSDSSLQIRENPQLVEHMLDYVCNNCKNYRKIYAIQLNAKDVRRNDKPIYTADYRIAGVIKLGEYPSFGAPLPAKLVTLIGSDRDYFLQGWRAENQGMGIGAFTYYRRVIENQKNKLIDKIIKVAKVGVVSQKMIENLEAAKKETQFSKAVDIIKDTIPESLKIKTHNPLTLIHQALSEGIHNDTDEGCLSSAKQIRVFLTKFSERLAGRSRSTASSTKRWAALGCGTSAGPWTTRRCGRSSTTRWSRSTCFTPTACRPVSPSSTAARSPRSSSPTSA